MIFVNGIDKYVSDLPSEIVDKISNLINKNNNIRLIITDGVYNVKKIMFEPFFQDYVVPTNGIWIGNGVSEQSILKVNNYNKQHTASISNDFGWVFKGGNAVLTKMLKTIEEGAEDEEQDTN